MNETSDIHDTFPREDHMAFLSKNIPAIPGTPSERRYHNAVGHAVNGLLASSPDSEKPLEQLEFARQLAHTSLQLMISENNTDLHGMMGIMYIHLSGVCLTSAHQFQAVMGNTDDEALLELFSHVSHQYLAESAATGVLGAQMLSGSRAHRSWGGYKAVRPLIELSREDEYLLDIAIKFLVKAHKDFVMGVPEELAGNPDTRDAINKLIVWGKGLMKTDKQLWDEL